MHTRVTSVGSSQTGWTFSGTHRVSLLISGRRVEGSPFMIATYAPHLVRIDPIPGGAVGKPVQFFGKFNSTVFVRETLSKRARSLIG